MDAQTARLVRIDLATGATRCLPRTPSADVSGVRVHPITREPQIVTVLKARSEYRVLDPSVADDLAAIRALHPGDPAIQNADDADRVWLVAFTNDAGPVPYFAYDREPGTASSCSSTSPSCPATSSRRWSRSRIRPGTA